MVLIIWRNMYSMGSRCNTRKCLSGCGGFRLGVLRTYYKFLVSQRVVAHSCFGARTLLGDRGVGLVCRRVLAFHIVDFRVRQGKASNSAQRAYESSRA